MTRIKALLAFALQGCGVFGIAGDPGVVPGADVGRVDKSLCDRGASAEPCIEQVDYLDKSGGNEEMQRGLLAAALVGCKNNRFPTDGCMRFSRYVDYSRPSMSASFAIATCDAQETIHACAMAWGAMEKECRHLRNPHICYSLLQIMEIQPGVIQQEHRHKMWMETATFACAFGSSEACEAVNEFKVKTPGFGTLSLEAYNMLYEGMSLTEANELFGQEGKQVSTTVVGLPSGTTVFIYRWGEQGGSEGYAELRFIDGLVYKREQVGLPSLRAAEKLGL